MKDASLKLVTAIPNAGSNVNTSVLDLNIEPHNNVWRVAHIKVAVPALTDHANTSVTNTITLQESGDNSNWANSTPLVQCLVAGVATNGSAASNFYVPLSPAIKKYIRFNVNTPANGGTGNNANITFDLVI
jgi:hypothetical protein